MLIKQKNNWFFRVGLIVCAVLNLLACAHQTTVTPSTGHIDGQNSTVEIPQVTAAPIPSPVVSSPVLPPPKAAKKPQTYSVVVNEVPVKEILFALARESKLNIDINPAIQGRATLNAVDQTLPAILERLARQVDLTYRMENNVLYVAPDQPVLRTYKVDYVNMNRDTKGFIGAAAEISSTGQSASTNGAGQTTVTSTSGNGANNSSRTGVTSDQKNHLWESLIQNIKDLLAETDKEVIVSRYGSLNENGSSEGMSADQARVQEANNKSASDQRSEQRSEFKTLFAANVIANPETGVISVRATNRQHEKVQEFIDQVMGRARKQVLIEATIVEVRLNDGYQAGINWNKLNLGNFSFSQVFTPLLTPSPSNQSPGTSAGLTASYSTNDISAAITLLKQFGDTKVLSSPKLMVLNNQTAVLKVVDNLVYFTVQAQQTTGSTTNQPFTTVTTTPNTVPVGIVMSVTPQIDDTQNVNINVRPTISSLIRYVPDPNPNIDTTNNNFQGIPEIQVREMESMLQINSGNTAVLGGLMQDQIRRSTDKVPGLSNIPGIGKLFTAKNDSNIKTELVIFLRPTVISNASLESEELQAYKQYLPSQQLQKVLEEAN